MTGLTAPAPDSAAPARSIAADGWFPAISTEDFRASVRIGEGAVSEARLDAAIEGAMLTGMRELSAWRSERASAGIVRLEDVTDLTLNDRNQAVLLWERIVRFNAAAELVDLHVDVSATDEAIDRNEEKAVTADRYRRLASAAVADMRALGTDTPPHGRNRVSLL